MERIDLFPCSIYKTKIELDSEYKKSLMETLEKNYKIDPERKSPYADFPPSDFHTYHGNFHDKKFMKVDLNPLIEIYDEIFKNFVNEELSLDKNLKYRWEITNINVGLNGKLKQHSHREIFSNGYTNQYVSVHYLSFDKTHHSYTNFLNPTNVIHMKDILCLSSILDSNDVKNSIYYTDWNLDVEEDDFVIFPNFLEHGVSQHDNSNEKYRITISSNFLINVTPVLSV